MKNQARTLTEITRLARKSGEGLPDIDRLIQSFGNFVLTLYKGSILTSSSICCISLHI